MKNRTKRKEKTVERKKMKKLDQMTVNILFLLLLLYFTLTDNH